MSLSSHPFDLNTSNNLREESNNNNHNNNSNSGFNNNNRNSGFNNNNSMNNNLNSIQATNNNNNNSDTSSVMHNYNGNNNNNYNQNNNSNVHKNVSSKLKSVTLKQLTCDLLSTYRSINKKYYETKEQRKPQQQQQQQHKKEISPFDSIFKQQVTLINRFYLMNDLGHGVSGRVKQAKDLQFFDSHVAIKIVKNKPAYIRQAEQEINILQAIQNIPGCVKWHSVFQQSGYPCLVFELLGQNLYKHIRQNRSSLNDIRVIATRLLQTLDGLQSINNGQGVIHCDIKPENIALPLDGNVDGVKLIDFGSSCFGGQQAHTYIQTRFYRAPEVVFQRESTCAIDMWSLGCVLAELYLQKPLFPAATMAQLLQQHIILRGLPPAEWLSASPEWLLSDPHTKKYFSQQLSQPIQQQQQQQQQQQFQLEAAPCSMTLEQLFAQKTETITKCTKENKDDKGDAKDHKDDTKDHKNDSKNNKQQDTKEYNEKKQLKQLELLILRMLEWNPKTRITPKDALRHEFITMDRNGIDIGPDSVDRSSSCSFSSSSLISSSSSSSSILNSSSSSSSSNSSSFFSSASTSHSTMSSSSSTSSSSSISSVSFSSVPLSSTSNSTTNNNVHSISVIDNNNNVHSISAINNNNNVHSISAINPNTNNNNNNNNNNSDNFISVMQNNNINNTTATNYISHQSILSHNMAVYNHNVSVYTNNLMMYNNIFRCSDVCLSMSMSYSSSSQQLFSCSCSRCNKQNYVTTDSMEIQNMF